MNAVGFSHCDVVNEVPGILTAMSAAPLVPTAAGSRPLALSRALPLSLEHAAVSVATRADPLHWKPPREVRHRAGGLQRR
jgi:hypothetical protein